MKDSNGTSIYIFALKTIYCNLHIFLITLVRLLCKAYFTLLLWRILCKVSTLLEGTFMETTLWEAICILGVFISKPKPSNFNIIQIKWYQIQYVLYINSVLHILLLEADSRHLVINSLLLYKRLWNCHNHLGLKYFLHKITEIFLSEACPAVGHNCP